MIAPRKVKFEAKKKENENLEFRAFLKCHADEFEEIKQVLQKDYEENKKPTGEFIRTFVNAYELCFPNDTLFDDSSLFGLF